MLIEIPDEMLARVVVDRENAGLQHDDCAACDQMQQNSDAVVDHVLGQYRRILDLRNRRSDNSVIVTMSDPLTGEVLETTECCDDYVLITAGSCHVAHENVYPGAGTIQVTIRGRRVT